MNAKSMTLPELYGVMDPVTRDWTDGLISKTFRDLNHPLPEGVDDILHGDDLQTRKFIQQARANAAQSVLEAARQDGTLRMLLDCSFPDELYANFDDWVSAMGSDDTTEDTSDLAVGIILVGQFLYPISYIITFRLGKQNRSIRFTMIRMCNENLLSHD